MTSLKFLHRLEWERWINLSRRRGHGVVHPIDLYLSAKDSGAALQAEKFSAHQDIFHAQSQAENGNRRTLADLFKLLQLFGLTFPHRR